MASFKPFYFSETNCYFSKISRLRICNFAAKAVLLLDKMSFLGGRTNAYCERRANGFGAVSVVGAFGNIFGIMTNFYQRKRIKKTNLII